MVKYYTLDIVCYYISLYYLYSVQYSAFRNFPQMHEKSAVSSVTLNFVHTSRLHTFPYKYPAKHGIGHEGILIKNYELPRGMNAAGRVPRCSAARNRKSNRSQETARPSSSILINETQVFHPVISTFNFAAVIRVLPINVSAAFIAGAPTTHYRDLHGLISVAGCVRTRSLSPSFSRLLPCTKSCIRSVC